MPHAASPSPGSADPDDCRSGPTDLATAVIAALPEFVPTFVALAGAGDDYPGDPVVLIELADFVSSRLAELASAEAVLHRALAVIEEFAGERPEPWEHRSPGVDEVAFAFLDSFTPEDRSRLSRWLGPCSRRLAESLDRPDPR